jgi:hypothetical protein
MKRTTTLMCLGLVVDACASETTGPGPGPTTDPPDAATAGDAGSGESCTTAGGDCRANAEVCCNGTTCVFDTSDRSKAVCAATCLRDDQCNSGCCTVLVEGTQAVCAPKAYCATSCVSPGGSCANAPCCENSVCVESTVTGISCAARCATHSQCRSGCCAPLSNTGELVCSPVTFCQ